MTNEKIVSRSLFHSCYVNDAGNGDDALVVSEMVEYESGKTEPRLLVHKNPKVSFWITKEAYRGHPDKKEFEHTSRLDQWDVYYKDKDKEIFRALNGFIPNHLGHKQRRELYQNQYVYGGNITVEALVGMKYKRDLQKANKISHSPTTGFFDIEQSLLPSSFGKLPLMVFTAENRVFLAMKESFMYEERDKETVRVTVEDIKEAVKLYIDPMVEEIFATNKDLSDYKTKLPFTYEYFVGETEVDMIKWIFGKMHETKTTFIGVWNLGFDIPEIIKVLEKNNIPLKDVFSDPTLRNTNFAYANFKEDKRQVHHFTQKWHWLSNTAHFQFVDSMALYSYIRQVDGKEASYALDDILKKFGLGGKLKVDKTEDLKDLQTADWHRVMLSKFFSLYAVYAMWDGMSLQILEWLNNDLTAMMLLSDTTPVKFFPNQTIRVTNTLFQEWKPKNWILGTGIDIEADRDEDLLTAGGAVLEPQNLVARGIKLFEEWPNHATHCYAWQSDLDFSAQYPNNIITLNISKQTKTSTMFTITGDHVNTKYKPDQAVEVLCSYLITPTANGVELGTEFFNLPDYSEMDKLFSAYLMK